MPPEMPPEPRQANQSEQDTSNNTKSPKSLRITATRHLIQHLQDQQQQHNEGSSKAKHKNEPVNKSATTKPQNHNMPSYETNLDRQESKKTDRAIKKGRMKK